MGGKTGERWYSPARINSIQTVVTLIGEREPIWELRYEVFAPIPVERSTSLRGNRRRQPNQSRARYQDCTPEQVIMYNRV